MQCVTTLVVGLLAAVGQAQESAHQKHLNAWAKDFAGEWVGESVLEHDADTLKKGTKFTAYHSIEWSPDKEALFLKYSAEADGKTFDTTKGIAGWDASKKAIVLRWFDSLGASGDLSYAKKGEVWAAEWNSSDAEGKRAVGTGTIAVKSDSQHSHFTNRKVDGESQPDSDMTWRRKS